MKLDAFATLTFFFFGTLQGLMDADSLYIDVGKRISRLRRELELTQVELGERISLSRASIANIERGHQKLSLHQIYQLAHALGIRPANLLPETKSQMRGPETELAISGVDDLSETAHRQVLQVYFDEEISQ